jgi:hypothetical protein
MPMLFNSYCIVYCLGNDDKKKRLCLFSTDAVFWSMVGWMLGSVYTEF